MGIHHTGQKTKTSAMVGDGLMMGKCLVEEKYICLKGEGHSKKCIFFVITIKSLYQVTLLTKVSASEVHELVSKEA